MFFRDPPTTATYPLSLHDALPILERRTDAASHFEQTGAAGRDRHRAGQRAAAALLRGQPRHQLLAREPLERRREDRKSTRLNSSHLGISYAVFCLKKKKKSGHTTA